MALGVLEVDETRLLEVGKSWAWHSTRKEHITTRITCRCNVNTHRYTDLCEGVEWCGVLSAEMTTSCLTCTGMGWRDVVWRGGVWALVSSAFFTGVEVDRIDLGLASWKNTEKLRTDWKWLTWKIMSKDICITCQRWHQITSSNGLVALLYNTEVHCRVRIVTRKCTYPNSGEVLDSGLFEGVSVPYTSH